MVYTFNLQRSSFTYLPPRLSLKYTRTVVVTKHYTRKTTRKDGKVFKPHHDHYLASYYERTADVQKTNGSHWYVTTQYANSLLRVPAFPIFTTKHACSNPARQDGTHHERSSRQKTSSPQRVITPRRNRSINWLIRLLSEQCK